MSISHPFLEIFRLHLDKLEEHFAQTQSQV